jgi:hypothetical protein
VMNGRVLTPSQLRTHITSIRQRVPPERMGVIGLHTSDHWEGPLQLDCDGETYDIIRANSILAIRETLLNSTGKEAHTVLLTGLEPAEFGQDLLARLAGGKLHPIELWQSVRGLFKARRIDPTIRGSSLAQALLDHAPTDGYPPVPAGVLDAATVWRSLLKHAFLMGDGELDLPRLLLWASTSPQGVERYRTSPVELRNALRERLTATIGASAGAVLTIIDSNHADTALALAIVCGVVFRAGEVHEDLREAAARLERFHGNAPLPPLIGEQLARAACECLREPATDQTSALAGHLGRADQLLHEIRAEQHAYHSDLSPLGLDQRLQRLANALQDALAEVRSSDKIPSPEAIRSCTTLEQEVRNHALIGRTPGRLEPLGMAIRLLRWLATPPASVENLSQAASRYRQDEAFVDWAREVLVGGDDHPALSTAYRDLEKIARQRRQTFNREFSLLLAEATAKSSPPTGVIPMEEALDRLVPLVQAGNRLLLIVLDGLSWAVAHELLAGLRRGHWQELSWEEEGSYPPPLLATIPSITEVSRTSLLTGQLRRGNAEDEKRLFTQHSSLSAACARRHPPVLFHKAELTEGSRGGLSDLVAQTILTPEKRVVAVVVNAIDDRLAGGQQIRDRWTVEYIRPLGALLQAARDAGRIVALASDHGHVWHRDDSILRKAEGGERWRPAEGNSEADELLLEGPRVRGPNDVPRVIVPWEEGLRYSMARNGYHGGASPQEMIVPLILLAPLSGQTRKGLTPCQLSDPIWWDEPLPATPARRQPLPPRPRVHAGPGDIQGDLFSQVREAAESPVDNLPAKLIASMVYRAQKELVGKHVPDDAAVVRCLKVLEEHDGTLTLAALAQQADIVLFRLDGFLAKLQRLLNVDGYEVLLVDRTQNRVSLHLSLLRRQFEL